eukprot:4119093-Amphidinium_carterae.1
MPSLATAREYVILSHEIETQHFKRSGRGGYPGGINSCPLCRKEQTLNPVNLEIETILGCASS